MNSVITIKQGPSRNTYCHAVKVLGDAVACWVVVTINLFLVLWCESYIETDADVEIIE